jgi:hypothetical protein
MAKKVALCVLMFGMTSVASAKGVIITDLCNDAQKLNLQQVDQTKQCQAAFAAESKHVAAPEIDPSSAIVGLTLLLGGVAVIRGRRVATSKA